MVFSEKYYILFAGANGTGKSTLRASLPHLCDLPYVNADEIARGLGECDSRITLLKAAKEALLLVNKYMENGDSFCQETTLSGKTILKGVQKAKSMGYRIIIYYVGVDSSTICKERIALRVKSGGHGISDKDVERRYQESFANMKAILKECDSVFFYDNTKSFSLFAKWNGTGMEILTDKVPGWLDKFFSLV